MKLNYDKHNGEIETLIEGLIAMTGCQKNTEIIREMILSALKAAGDNMGRGDLKIINNTIKEMRYSFNLFARYTDKRKVTVFGSARIKDNEPAYELAREFSRKISQWDYMVITGAGGGIMQAGNEGAGTDNSFGVGIDLPFEQSANQWIHNDIKLINFKYFFTRKVNFLKEASAVVLFPGGFGTHDEAFETLTLVQTGKSNIIPVIFIDPTGNNLWRGLEEYMRVHLYRTGLISEDDMHLYTIMNSIDDAISEILHFYKRFHSYRYVRDHLVIRMNSPLTAEQLDFLNHDFKDILVSGTIEATGPLPEEQEEAGTLHLPRLKLHFDRRSLGRLRLLIDMLNGFEIREDQTLETQEGPSI
ncbi:TIGR00730 family Rossman fold protein [Desulfurispirillum indicum]|uniref:LOG family protein n=1 Tax=Desulfurispirillum indicum TaxID=936456 RepID=UPI001CFB9614|nr:TIGR00730 family Rossman fold protein [Desulfurispirillum indicum]UCZ56124.1 TIGR00730 family Rossman fold protein [Desulfurispirillum indicum]